MRISYGRVRGSGPDTTPAPEQMYQYAQQPNSHKKIQKKISMTMTMTVTMTMTMATMTMTTMTMTTMSL